jgi:hypothetical protein
LLNAFEQIWLASDIFEVNANLPTASHGIEDKPMRVSQIEA